MAAHFPGLPMWAVALGIGFAPIPVFVFAYLPEIVKSHEVGMGMGMLTVASNIGTTLGPSSIGSILDQTGGSFLISFMVLAALSLIIIVFSLGLKGQSSQKNG